MTELLIASSLRSTLRLCDIVKLYTVEDVVFFKTHYGNIIGSNVKDVELSTSSVV